MRALSLVLVTAWMVLAPPHLSARRLVTDVVASRVQHSEFLEAVRKHDAVAVGALIEHVSPRDLDTFLEAAIERDDVAIVRLLLSKGANPDFGINGPAETPLISAARLGCWEVTDVLLKAGADPNGRAGLGRNVWFPLYLGASGGHEHVVAQLLSANADPNARVAGSGDPSLPSGQTALMAAARRGDTQMVESLLKAGADPKLTDSKGRTAAEYLNEHTDDVARVAALLTKTKR